MKNKSHFIFLSLRKNILPIFFLCFTIFLVIFSKQNLTATKNGLLLWANSVVPALLPFFIATELLNHTNIVSYIGKLLNKFMRPLFNVPGSGAYAFIMGIISGYPVGAKIVTKFREDGICTKAECERLLAFTNNSGPLFIIGTVGISMFGDTRIGILLFISHFISCIIVGLIFRYWKFNDAKSLSKNINTPTKNINFSDLGNVLSSSITNAINTVIMIGGFVILFSVIISILENSKILNLLSQIIYPIFNLFKIDIKFCKPFISGFFEITNGINQISNITSKALSINIVFTSFLLGFGGFSILLQVLAILSKSDISIKPYFIGKLLHGIISSFITYVIIHNIPIFNMDLVTTFSPNVNNSVSNNYMILFLIPFILFIFNHILSRKKSKQL